MLPSGLARLLDGTPVPAAAPPAKAAAASWAHSKEEPLRSAQAAMDVHVDEAHSKRVRI
jgi:hypothetical protein